MCRSAFHLEGHKKRMQSNPVTKKLPQRCESCIRAKSGSKASHQHASTARYCWKKSLQFSSSWSRSVKGKHNHLWLQMNSNSTRNCYLVYNSNMHKSQRIGEFIKTIIFFPRTYLIDVSDKATQLPTTGNGADWQTWGGLLLSRSPTASNSLVKICLWPSLCSNKIK
jgi:hypothetical protein